MGYALVCLLLLTSFDEVDAREPPWEWQLPPGFPEPLVPATNPMSKAKVALGKMLFVERGLAVNGKLACSDCHHPNNYFVDNVVVPTGALGEELAFNTPSLWNVAYSTSFSWVDKGLHELEAQHLGPLTNTDPIELGTGLQQLQTVQDKPEIAAALHAAFPEQEGVLQLETVAAALASYLRTLVKGGTSFDEYVFGDNPSALSTQAQKGLALFTSQRLNCAACHRGFLLSGPTRSTQAEFSPSFYQTGIGHQPGAIAVRTPSLRFVQHTAPYMHDGSMNTLDAVIDFYESAGVTSLGPKARLRLRSFKLTTDERHALLAFLQSL